MPTRYVQETITTNDALASVSPEAERLYHRLWVKVDDYGRFDARDQVILAACFPLQLVRITGADVVLWLLELQKVGLVVLYTVADRPYLLLPEFVRVISPRAEKSKFPAPGADAGTCKRLHTDVDNGIQLYPEPYSEPYSESETKPRARATPLPMAPAPGSASEGRKLAALRQQQNAEVPKQLARELTDVVLEMTGQTSLANTDSDEGDRILNDAHAKVVVMYKMDYRTPEDLRRLEKRWYKEDFRGIKGSRPSLNWLLEFASLAAASPPSSGNGAQAPPQVIKVPRMITSQEQLK
jgi:hypothetical protein